MSLDTHLKTVQRQLFQLEKKRAILIMKKNKSALRSNNLSALKQLFTTAFQLFKKIRLQSLLGSVAEEAAISTCQPTPLVRVTSFRSGLFSSGIHQLLQSTTQFNSSPHGAWGHSLVVDLVVLGLWFASMILRVFSSVNDSMNLY
uniref:Uncharacterized protein n=1 Tax=Bubo bubo TaxID=30461 RepID=A0A8C0IHF1_BUBBB